MACSWISIFVKVGFFEKWMYRTVFKLIRKTPVNIDRLMIFVIVGSRINRFALFEERGRDWIKITRSVRRT